MMQTMEAVDGNIAQQTMSWKAVERLQPRNDSQGFSVFSLDPTVNSQDRTTIPVQELKDETDVTAGMSKDDTNVDSVGVTKKLSDEQENFEWQGVQFSSFKCKKVGNYLLGPSIGEGSYGKMRLATHFISKQMVAAKVVNKKLLVQREVARRHFRRETLLLQRVFHPNIVKLYEAMETCNSYYLVFELVNGGSLLDILAKKGQFSEDETRRYLRQVTSAVDHLHRSDVVHRDIKLENLLIDSSGDVKLVDFGLSAVCHDSDHQLSTQCGSPVYAAPELFAGRKYGKPVDLWSIGVCLFAMVTGTLPFTPESGSSLTQLYSLILKGCVVPGYLSLNCQNLLGRLLDLQEGRRISAEELMSHPWITGPDGQRLSRVPVNSFKVPVDHSIVTIMTCAYRFNLDDVMASVQQRKLNSTAATYNILKDSVEKGLIKSTFTDGVISLTAHGTGSDDCAEVITSSRAGEISQSPENKEPLLQRTLQNMKESPPSLESYKSHILLLKQSRGSRRSKEAHNSKTDKHMSGKSPLDPIIGSQGAIPFFITPISAAPLTLPPIQTSESTGAVPNGRITLKETDGKRHFILPDRRSVLRLNVKGEAPNLCDRAKLHLPPTGSQTNSMVHGFNSRTNPPPPPPPPNSFFGDNSAVSRSTVSQTQDLRKLSNGSESRGAKDQENERTEEELKETFVSRLRFFREPRASLATLRDPFGTDSWRRSRPGQRMSGNHQRDSHPAQGSHKELNLKAVSDLEDWRDKFSGHGDLRETVGDNVAEYTTDHVNSRETGQVLPSASLDLVTMPRFPGVGVTPLDTQDSPRQGSVTPLSQSQEYPSPVTRVTITTTGHH